MHIDCSGDKATQPEHMSSLVNAIDVITDGFALFDADRRLIVCNQAYKDMRPDVADLLVPGAHYENLLHVSFSARHPDSSKPELNKLIEEKCLIFEQEAFEQTIEIATGQWIRMRAHRTASGGTVLLRTDVSELVNTQRQLKIESEKLKELAYHDLLTGLPNRKKCVEAINYAIDIAQRRDDQFSIFAIDLNKFKEINDTLGHQAGDCALCQFGERVNTIIRKSDIFARMGGDEFILLCPTCPSHESAEAVIKKLYNISRRPYLVAGQPCEMGCSIGVAIYPDDGRSSDILLRNADSAMYSAKKSGKPSAFYDPLSMEPYQAVF